MRAPLRTKSIGTKVSEEEFAALEAKARAADMTLSESVREGRNRATDTYSLQS